MTRSVCVSADEPEPSAEVPLEVKLEIEPHEETDCTVVNYEHEVAEITQRLKQEDCGGDGTRCQTAVTLESSRKEFLTNSTDRRCICPVFEETDCIPELETVRDGSLFVSLIVPDRTELGHTIDRLRDVGARVSLRRITRFDEDGGTTVELDVSEVTAKQFEAIEIAVSEGYYDAPRRTDLADLADQLGVSKSAVSQRLNTVEAKLVRSLAEEL